MFNVYSLPVFPFDRAGTLSARPSRFNISAGMNWRCIAAFIFLFGCFLPNAHSEVIRGVYGVPTVGKTDPSESILKHSNINAVFSPAHPETIKWFKKRGLKVFISINVFGGKGAWKRYPDSRPIKDDGAFLGSMPGYRGHGGVCPTHRAWRRERLDYIEGLLNRFGGEDGIDGIWLDFIRYPGLWEVEKPEIPDTCYCRRCLKKFQQDRDILLPHGLKASEAAALIKKDYAYEWMRWKKAQISSFVTEVREILNGSPAGGSIILGLFLAPWSKGEKENAISFVLAQDPFQLSGQADVISPMLYHRMCGRPESWVGYMTRYYRETAFCPVWPIVQSVDCSSDEFSNVIKYAGQAGADGILVYSFNHMKSDHLFGLAEFKRPVNLINNPEFLIAEGDKLPAGWYTEKPVHDDMHMTKSSFFVKPSTDLNIRKKGPWPPPQSDCIGISAGNDRAGAWCNRLPLCEPGRKYLFTCRLFRKRWENGIYPDVGIWGKAFDLNTHLLAGTFQPFRLYMTCPEECEDNRFRFINNNPGYSFCLAEPHLAEYYSFDSGMMPNDTPLFFPSGFFPIGVYGAGKDNIEEIKRLAVNTVLIGGRGKELKDMVLKCRDIGLKYVISVPRDPDRIPIFLDEIGEYTRSDDLAFYVNDEPGIHSFPINSAGDINRLIKERFPDAATCMAVVRPQVCLDYLEAADFFMMDQYPVPYMPMTWLSDSIDRACLDVGGDRIVSVVQAFGGEKWADVGWPRLPAWQEMDCLAFLSIVHGSRGIFFFTYGEIGKTHEGRQRLGRVVGRLNRLYPWLTEKNLPEKVDVEMVSACRMDPFGRSAVQCCLKKRDDQILLIAVNTIGTYVEALIKFAGSGAGKVKEVFSGEPYAVTEDGLRTRFGPYETRAFLFKNH